MKKFIPYLGSFLIAGSLLAGGRTAVAQAAVETTTTTSSAGTITQFEPGMFSIRTETSTAPVRYTYTKSTTYVDETGAPVSMETVRSGLPVTVYYDRSGDDMVARKVVVRRAVRTEAPAGATVERQETTRTYTGTVGELSPEAITVRTESGPQQVRYSRTTTYVDESGAPVTMETVRSGLPVTVYYEREGDGVVARKVVVRRTVSAPAPAAGEVIEHKTTTTTTTDK